MQYLNQVKTEFAQKTQDELTEAQRREFNTTNKDTFVKHVRAILCRTPPKT